MAIACSRKAGQGKRRPLATRRKSARRFRVSGTCVPSVGQDKTAGTGSTLTPGGVPSVGTGPFARAIKSRRKFLAPDATTRIQDLLASFGGHTRTEPVAALADQITGLIGAFHRAVPFIRATAIRQDSETCSRSGVPDTSDRHTSQFGFPFIMCLWGQGLKHSREKARFASLSRDMGYLCETPVPCQSNRLRNRLQRKRRDL